MVDTDRSETDLEQVFAAARGAEPGLPDGLEQRILRDARMVQAEWAQCAGAARAPRWRSVLDLLGGWPAMAGMAAACAAGVWIGFAPPQALPDPAQLVLSEPAMFDDDDLVLAMAEELE